MGKERVWDCIWLLAWGIASSAWCLGSAASIGATFDEPGDVAAGLEFWHTGSHGKLLRVGAMPLPMDVCALPIYVQERLQGGTIDLLHGNQRQAMFLARTGTLAFWWLLLCYGWRAGRELGGPWGGRLAIALIAAEPTLLAHAALATKDIAISACLLAFVYHFRTGRDGRWWARVGLPGIWFGVALLAKASALAFGPLCMLAVEAERLVRQRRNSLASPLDTTAVNEARFVVSESPQSWGTSLASWLRDSLAIGLIGVGLASIYCGSDWEADANWVKWAHGLPSESDLRVPMVWLSEHVRIFHNAGTALAWQIGHNLRGHDGTFLLGRTTPHSIWYYFPVALSMKLTAGLLLLPLVLLVVRPRSLTNWACVAAAVLLVYSVKCNVQIGVRLMLPLVVLGMVGLAAALANACRESGPGWRRQILRGAGLCAVGWAVLASTWVWPHGLCYVNEFWGGTDRGYLCLSDSNYDWGQGLPELAAWQQRQGADVPLDVWYFGTDPLLKTLPLRSVPLHIIAPSREELLKVVHGRCLAVSTTMLHGYLPRSGPAADMVEFLRRTQPIDRTQTFLIFDFRE
jgi:hypothetical protein